MEGLVDGGRSSREGNRLRRLLLFGGLLVGVAVVSLLASREDGAPAASTPLPRDPGPVVAPRLVGLSPAPTQGRPFAGEGSGQERPSLPPIATTLFVQDGRPPDHPTSYRIQERVWRYLHAEEDPVKRAAARRLIERLKVIRKEEGEVLR